MSILVSAMIVAGAQSSPEPASEEFLREQALLEASATWIEGYAEALAGETIDYPRLRADCPIALLTRTTDGKMAIEWCTAPVPEDLGDEPRDDVVFGWLAGIDLNDASHRFDVFVNDVPRFSFQSSQAEEWSVDGEGGGRFAMHVLQTDQHADGFGFAELAVPRGWIEPGAPARIRIVGEAADSPVWFMTYECPDALSIFRARSEREGWIEVRAHRDDESDRLTIRTPARWYGRHAVLLVAGQKFVEAELGSAGPDGSTDLFVHAPPGTLAGALSITLDDRLVLPPTSVFTGEDASYLHGEELIEVRHATEGSDRATISVAIHHRPHLVRRLLALSTSPGARGTIHLISSSHQDIAWMDSPEQCIEDRDVRLITPALEFLQTEPECRFDMENVLCLREYLERHPHAREVIAQLAAEGRLDWGATYTAPYEEMYSGEALVRQLYLGRLWLRREFPGATGDTYWNVDVPGRSAQMPQILARGGVRNLIISRHDEGLFRWLSPDGSGVLTYSPGHYGDSYPYLHRDFFDAAEHVVELCGRWVPRFPADGAPPAVPLLSDWDMAPPEMYRDLVERWGKLTKIVDEKGEVRELTLPPIVPSTASEFMAAAERAATDLPSITGERPNVWIYIHGPAHQRAIAAGREAGRLLPEAEIFSTIDALLAGGFDGYPQERLTAAWEAAIYPDHGWGGKHGDITDALFREKFEHARDEGRAIRDEAQASIACRIATESEKGQAVVVFNGLSWARTEPVSFELDLGEDPRGVVITDVRGAPVPAQVEEIEGEGDRARVTFLAEVPSIGYATYYMRRDGARRSYGQWGVFNAFETHFYRVRLGPGGIESIHDRDLDRELLASDGLAGGELFTLHSWGHGAGEFGDVQQPTLEEFTRLRDHESTGRVVAPGPLYMRLRTETQLEHARVIRDIVVWHTIKRIDFELRLLDWDGTPWREFRLAYPLALPGARVSYEVPYGIVNVGEDEIAGAAGERYTSACAEVHPRGIGNWISAADDTAAVTLSSSVAVWDWIDPRNPERNAPFLQPILLASRHSCHGEGFQYAQPGDHSFRFSLTSHAPDLGHADRFGKAAVQPLTVFLPTGRGAATLPETRSFFSVDSPAVHLATWKKSEEGDDTIVRLFETLGVDTVSTITMHPAPRALTPTNLIEEESGAAPIEASPGFAVPISAHAIETFVAR